MYDGKFFVYDDNFYIKSINFILKILLFCIKKAIKLRNNSQFFIIFCHLYTKCEDISLIINYLRFCDYGIDIHDSKHKQTSLSDVK
jgi:hypothetical protein